MWKPPDPFREITHCYRSGHVQFSSQLSTFYIELKPINEKLTAESAIVHKLSLERLMVEGVAPEEALQRFEEWLKSVTAVGMQPVFVAVNAAFDWMFINYYFIHYLGHNPFGYSALDIKAFYMGQAGVPWSQTSWRFISPQYAEKPQLTHHALQDALDQAELFKKILREIEQIEQTNQEMNNDDGKRKSNSQCRPGTHCGISPQVGN